MAKNVILGIDEVGRGPWAGPLVVGAVILGETIQAHPDYQKLKDSKKLSAKKRDQLNDFILDSALATGIGWVGSTEIDRYGLGLALKLAARRAVKQILQQKILFESVIIDGTINLLSDTPLQDKVTLLKKADDLVKEVSAASIIAKVARDRYMQQLAVKYPHYGFENNVGYGTSAHRQGLENYGICPEHRRSFRPVQKFIADSDDMPARAAISSQSTKCSMPLCSTDLGQTAERAIAEYLEQQGHNIIVQNFRTATCEIDIISAKSDKIFFTEVKYSQSSTLGNPLNRIDNQKQEQMEYAAKVFLAKHPKFLGFQPILAGASVEGEKFDKICWVALDS